MFLVDLLGEIKTSWLLFTLLLLCIGQSTQNTPRVGGWMGEYMCVSFFLFVVRVVSFVLLFCLSFVFAFVSCLFVLCCYY